MSFVTARFVRAIFFVVTFFLSHTYLWGGEFRFSFRGNSMHMVPGEAKDRMRFLREGHATLGSTSGVRNRASRHHCTLQNLFHAQEAALEEAAHLEKITRLEQAVLQEAIARQEAFANFCHKFLKVKVGKTALYLLQRFMTGLEQGGIDIRKALARERQNGINDFAPGFLQKVQGQSVKEAIGDVMQLLSRKIVHASAIIVAIAAIAITIEAGAAVAAGTAGATTAQKLFEPFEVSVNSDGTAAIQAAASSGTSVWQVIAAAVSQAVQAFVGLAESFMNLFCAMEGDGGGGDKPASTPIGRRGQPINCPGSNSAQTINGRVFTGHALDRMQGRGITPSVVENAIQNGVALDGNTPETTAYVFKNVKVVVNNIGYVVTVIPQ